MQELILAVPPAYLAEGRGQAVFAADHCKQLVPFVDGFSLMTYDWNIGAPGPNAPFPWVEANVRSLLPACKRCASVRYRSLEQWGKLHFVAITRKNIYPTL